MAKDDSTPARRRWTPAILFGLACVFGVLTLLGQVVLPAIRQAEAVRALEADGAGVGYDWREGSDAGWYDKIAAAAPEDWTHLFYNIESVRSPHFWTLPEGYLRRLEALPRLKFVSLPVSRLSADDIEILAGLPLIQLDLARGYDVDDELVEGLLRFQHLDELTLDARGLSDAGIARMASLPALKRLMLTGGQFDGGCFGQFRTLVSLHLVDCRLGERAVAEISKIESLVDVELRRTNVASINDLKRLKKLAKLNVQGSCVDDEGLREIGEFPLLQSLDIAGNPVTDAGAEHLSKAGLLDCLDLSDTQISDAGLKRLAALTDLRTLRLSRIRVTDAGVAELAGLPDLHSLSVDGTVVSQAAIERVVKPGGANP